MMRLRSRPTRLSARPVTAVALSLALTTPLASCGGGGGGGGGASGGTAPLALSSVPAPVPAPAPGFQPRPVSGPITTTEYNRQVGLAAINAAGAYARGATGHGETIAVVDTGLDLTHPDLAGQVAGTGWDYQADAPVSGDVHGHGTFVAGLAAAARDGQGMHGVAFESRLLPFKLLADDGTVGSRLSNRALPDILARSTAAGARIVNYSWGQATPVTAETAAGYAGYHPDALAAFRSSSQLHVWSTGNNGGDQPSIESGLPALYPELADRWVAVTSVGIDGRETSYGNRCGAAAAWCVAAPGGTPDAPIASTTSGGGTGLAVGTSMAAPQVAGALAVLMQRFPGLAPSAVADRLFATASLDGLVDRDGNAASAAVFGHGLIDLEAASAPIGGLSIASGDHLATAVAFDPAATVIDSGAAFGDGLTRGLADLDVTAFDSLGAPFTVTLDAAARRPAAAFDTPAAMRRLAGDNALKVTPLPGLGAIGYAPGAGDSLREVAEDSRLALTTEMGDLTIEATRNVSPADGFGLRRRHRAAIAGFADPDSFRAPWLSWAEDGQALALAANGPFHGRLRVSGFAGAAPDSAWLRVDGVAAEWTQPLAGGLRLGLMGGSLRESATVLGTRGSGALALDEDVPTRFVGLSLDVPLTGSLTLAGSLHVGWTRPDAAQAGLISAVSPLRSDSATLGLLGKDLARAGDTYGVAIHQPLRLDAGTATLSLPTGRTADGALTRRDLDLSLEPSGRELDLQAFYGLPTGLGSRLDATAMLRLEPGHDAAAAPEAVGLLRWSMAW